ncbi:Ankyrin 1 [Alloactinosynnema sp. L-07]|uniref:ankyrin repeat domain-containing protein n=1 Tax=Alloactinosynnema sp. L-07 TaxID=1653480 RepID=UPI00065EFB37|nr:ankyrin repeat domain-containing protein [Alloactinosynnema sp. L-07]CRK62106.1 Ankyrin 1 [Alloactinosynnema sp. L-07]
MTFARSPHQVTAFDSAVDEFLAHACLVYGGDGPHRLDRARAMLAADPSLAAANLHTIAALGDVDAARGWLADHPEAAREQGGPFGWEPLLYLSYSRLPGGDPVGVARLLLDAGADPNAGYLWEGLCPPFTALTGAFGEGEDTVNEPRHQAEQALARLLLAAGADPNDGQALYNRMFGADDGHLRLLFEFGLGRGDGGPWKARLGAKQATPEQMIHDVLLWAAGHGQRDRVALLLDHRVAPESEFRGHPLHHGRSPWELAVRAGESEIADLLVAAGARPVDLDDVDQFFAAAMRGDSVAVAATAPEVVRAARERGPTAVVDAAELGKAVSVRLLVDAGFDVNAAVRETALHQAAFAGDLPLVRLLLDLGADPTRQDTEFGSTPQGWAEHAGHHDVAEHLRQLP